MGADPHVRHLGLDDAALHQHWLGIRRRHAPLPEPGRADPPRSRPSLRRPPTELAGPSLRQTQGSRGAISATGLRDEALPPDFSRVPNSRPDYLPFAKYAGGDAPATSGCPVSCQNYQYGHPPAWYLLVAPHRVGERALAVPGRRPRVAGGGHRHGLGRRLVHVVLGPSGVARSSAAGAARGGRHRLLRTAGGDRGSREQRRVDDGVDGGIARGHGATAASRHRSEGRARARRARRGGTAHERRVPRDRAARSRRRVDRSAPNPPLEEHGAVRRSCRPRRPVVAARVARHAFVHAERVRDRDGLAAGTVAVGRLRPFPVRSAPRVRRPLRRCLRLVVHQAAADGPDRVRCLRGRARRRLARVPPVAQAAPFGAALPRPGRRAGAVAPRLGLRRVLDVSSQRRRAAWPLGTSTDRSPCWQLVPPPLCRRSALGCAWGAPSSSPSSSSP